MNKINRVLLYYNKILSSRAEPRFKSANLEGKIKRALGILESCELCERKCGVNRVRGKLGFCRVGDDIRVISMFSHWGEEFFLVPSFTIFLWSCTFSCRFCQNWPISQRFEGYRVIKEKELARRIDECGCKNVNFVGGEPTPYLPLILKTLRYVKKNIPVVWNSNFYMSEKSMELLKGVVDVYLSDFKYGNSECALRLSGVKNYMDIVGRNHLLAFKDSALVIRHLVLPNHVECCSKPIMDFISEKFGDRAIVNIMYQYRPEYKAMETRDINRGVTREEFSGVVDYARKLGLNFIT